MRPTKDKYFIQIAEICATRSRDIHTQVGCVIISPNGNIISTGYNGPPRGVDDSKVPLTRPEKYTFMVHAEQNCICNAARHGISLDGGIAYVTSIPCVVCLRGLYQAGITEVVCLDSKSRVFQEEDQKFFDFIKYYIKIRVLK